LKFNLKFNHKLVKEENVFTLESDLSYIINIYKALNYFIKEDLMEGNNKIYCSKCKKFYEAKKRLS
jgi:ubiquitin C-terminal hydrolase